MGTFEQHDFVPFDTDANERRFSKYVHNTQQAVSQAVLRYLPGAVLPEPAATAVLPDNTFGQLLKPGAGITSAIYFAGFNLVTVPQDLADTVLTAKTPADRLHATATFTEEFLHDITTLPLAQPVNGCTYRTGFEPSVSENVSLLKPGGVFKYMGKLALSDVLRPIEPDYANEFRVLTEAATDLAVHLLLPEVARNNDYPYLLIRVMTGNWPEVLIEKNPSLTAVVLNALYTGNHRMLDIQMPVTTIKNGVLQFTSKKLRDLLVHPKSVILSLRSHHVPVNERQLRDEAFIRRT